MKAFIKSPLLQFVCVESLVTAVVDMYPETFRRGYRRELLILGMSVVSFFIGLIMCTEVRIPLKTSSPPLPSHHVHPFEQLVPSKLWLSIWVLSVVLH